MNALFLDLRHPGVRVDAGPVIGLALTPAMAQQCTVVPSGAIAWYRGEQNADDSPGFYNSGLHQGATYGAGKVGQALHLGNIELFRGGFEVTP